MINYKKTKKNKHDNNKKKQILPIKKQIDKQKQKHIKKNKI